jgi:spore maturation protein CgeB
MGTGNWKDKLRKNPFYIFYLLKKLVFGPKDKKTSGMPVSTVEPEKPEAVEVPVVPQPIAPEPPEVETEAFSPDPAKLTLACIMDVFTKSCFSPEFNTLSPTPENWKQTLDRYPADALFVESAWHGNDDSWIYKVGKYNEKNLETILSLIDTCKEKNIPSIFWNKEDPVHFEKFIDPAYRFDYVFTTDADCIPQYMERTRKPNVFALPFAAQPQIHNPVREAGRDGNVCFAGTYHAARYAERRSDMDVILKPALDFGLDIYDRMYGADPKVAANYRFPDIYQPSIKGKLDYDDMVKAYRKYKVFLNVNSVRNSPTMFARRVFELLACGTPVISTYSKGIIEILGEDTVFITETEEETTKYLDKLINDGSFWWKQSLHGIRKVLENHTYHHRTGEIFRLAGLKFEERPPVKFLAVVPVSSEDQLRAMATILKQQSYKDFKVIFLVLQDGLIPETSIDEICALLSPLEVFFHSDISSDIHDLLADMPGYDFFSIFLPGHYYGVNYLRDYALAVNYSTAVKFGKKSCFGINDNGSLSIENQGDEFRMVNDVISASLVIRKDLLITIPAGFLRSNKMYTSSSRDILSIDPYNFILNGAGVSEKVKNEVSL